MNLMRVELSVGQSVISVLCSIQYSLLVVLSSSPYCVPQRLGILLLTLVSGLFFSFAEFHIQLEGPVRFVSPRSIASWRCLSFFPLPWLRCVEGLSLGHLTSAATAAAAAPPRPLERAPPSLQPCATLSHCYSPLLHHHHLLLARCLASHCTRREDLSVVKSPFLRGGFDLVCLFALVN